MKSHIRLAMVFVLVVLLAVSLLASGCISKKASSGTSAPKKTAPAAVEDIPTTAEGVAVYIPAYKPNGKEKAVFETSQGTIEVQLYGDEAPATVGSFIELARKGFYDGTKFHRYEPGFVVQGGDPQTQEMSAKEVVDGSKNPSSGLGTGGPGYNIQGEFDPLDNPNKHVKGALGMARSQDPNSAGSQFYFTLGNATFLDGQYTVFGEVTKGLDVMDKLRLGDTIESIKILGAN